ncbi:MAG: glycosyltransferase [Candidatus Omnitrophica bacterium CG11_big_fil_rev_8_21_14_0_20_63_9]|nr:MAG: glycosyltransferase [Candidatus Omnitrophica bacterium CG11_big_fil_rev_8_21_14_0_20_63_9]
MVLGRMSYAQNSTAVLAPSSQSAIDFRLALRALWQYQVTWTRSYVVSVLSNLDDADSVERKLVKNQEQIGNVIKPYYGGLAGNRLAVLLREHIVIAVEIVRAIKANDQDALRNAQATGRENANAIANLLSRAKNPLWDRHSLEQVFYKHLEYVTMQVDYRLKQDWASEISAYDAGLQHVLLLADILAEGVVRQFPEKFTE